MRCVCAAADEHPIHGNLHCQLQGGEAGAHRLSRDTLKYLRVLKDGLMQVCCLWQVLALACTGTPTSSADL